jgi:endoribonuclease Dicer
VIQEIVDQTADSDRKIIFLANTVPLVTQQYNFLRKFVTCGIEEYYGDKRLDGKVLDTWDQAIWDKELANNKILVMSPAILVDMLNHSFISVADIRMIVFDECHHTTGKHPYSQVLNEVKKNNVVMDIKLLGLTASIAVNKCDLRKFKEQLNELESKFGYERNCLPCLD